jgi:hypothetical protein
METTMKIPFAGYHLLTLSEQTLFEKLQKVDSDSVWGMAIKNVCENANVLKFRKLVCQLLSQTHDEPYVMENILGSEAYQALITLV